VPGSAKKDILKWVFTARTTAGVATIALRALAAGGHRCAL